MAKGLGLRLEVLRLRLELRRLRLVLRRMWLELRRLRLELRWLRLELLRRSSVWRMSPGALCTGVGRRLIVALLKAAILNTGRSATAECISLRCTLKRS